jgi:hypothetical protein
MIYGTDVIYPLLTSNKIYIFNIPYNEKNRIDVVVLLYVTVKPTVQKLEYYYSMEQSPSREVNSHLPSS